MAIVLIVDDEYGIADLLDAILGDEGHRVLIASNGRQGLELVAGERPDLIFLDYMMPVMDGAAMLRGLKSDPALQAIPVVLMSSMPETTVSERCSGYATFLRKPFRIQEVLTVSESLIGKPIAPGVELPA